jgi:hypothetical protein
MSPVFFVTCMIDLESRNDLKLSDAIIEVWWTVFLSDVSEVKQASNNDIVNPMASPKKKFSREDCMPPNTATKIKYE